MDRLSRWAAAALREGMHYGQWVAKHHPPGSVSRAAEEGERRPGRHICQYCGKEFVQYDNRRRKYCCERCRIAAYDKSAYRRKMTDK